MRSVKPRTDGPAIVEVGVPTHRPNGHVLIVGVIRVGWLAFSCVAGESRQPDVPMRDVARSHLPPAPRRRYATDHRTLGRLTRTRAAGPRLKILGNQGAGPAAPAKLVGDLVRSRDHTCNSQNHTGAAATFATFGWRVTYRGVGARRRHHGPGGRCQRPGGVLLPSAPSDGGHRDRQHLAHSTLPHQTATKSHRP